ncbi:MAG: hypothetical protein LBH90_02360 [Tannerella sp.]|jgi:hypothetical protein|nr:hypothetical protein [Tannerella sp.]
MIAESQNAALLIVGRQASRNENWVEYARYCFDREKGLRKEAFAHLNKFLNLSQSWETEQKIAFLQFLLPLSEIVQDADYGPLPQPLSEKLIKPSLEEWCLSETKNSDPFRWYGRYCRSVEHIDRALEINPQDDKARQILLEWGTYQLYFSVHHLPEGYIGNLTEDMELIDEIRKHINQLTEPKSQEFWSKELEEYAVLIHNYSEWKKSGHPNLEKWGEENKRLVSYGISRTYYYDSK